MQSQIDALTEVVNVELEAGNWSGVVTLTAELYGCAVVAAMSSWRSWSRICTGSPMMRWCIRWRWEGCLRHELG